MGEVEYVRSLFVTLKRSFLRTPWLHKRILTALGLRKRHHCVEKPNNDSIRGMLLKVPHLVMVETDKMYYLRNMKQHYQQLTRAPLVISHAAPSFAAQGASSASAERTAARASTSSASSSSPPITRFAQKQLEEHLLPTGMEGFEDNYSPKLTAEQRNLQAIRRQRMLHKHGPFSSVVRDDVQYTVESRLEAAQRAKEEREARWAAEHEARLRRQRSLSNVEQRLQAAAARAARQAGGEQGGSKARGSAGADGS